MTCDLRFLCNLQVLFLHDIIVNLNFDKQFTCDGGHVTGCLVRVVNFMLDDFMFI